MNNDVISLIVEAWRFSKVFKDVLPKLNEGDFTRFSGRYSWFRRRLDEIASAMGLKVIEISPGTDYDVGMAVTPINIDDFQAGDVLQVESMIEPVIMNGDSVIRTGTVILRRTDDE